MPYYNSMDKPGEDRLGVSVADIGMSTAPMKNQLDELKSKIRAGISKLELGFWGAGKGYGENLTPGLYGKEQRQAIRELAKLNHVELSTHATPNIGPVSGFTQQGFKEEARKQATDEIKRAIDFAADVAEGGPIVMHTGEFQRSIASVDKSGKFQGYTYEAKRLNKETGEMEEREITEDEESVAYLADEKTGQIIDQVKKNMPIFLPEEQTDEGGEVEYIRDDDGEIKIFERDWNWVVKKTEMENAKRRANNEKELKPEEWYFHKKIEERIGQLEGNIAHSQLQREMYASDPRHADAAKQFDAGIVSMKQQIKEMQQAQKNAKPIEEVALQNTAESIANLGMYAMKKQESKGLQRDLYVAPENIFPEQYGSHPDEMVKIIQAGRDRMAHKLKKQGYGEEKARKMAADHIKATFDIGHAFTWRKYFEGSDEEFKDWMLGKVDELKNKGILGHVHVSDNFGYNDEHTTPGQGEAPIKEIAEKLKGKNVDFVIETGSQGDEALWGAFKEFGSPVYGVAQRQGDPWSQIENSYFGRTATPYFVVGQYGQDMGERVAKDFSSWAGVPFE